MLNPKAQWLDEMPVAGGEPNASSFYSDLIPYPEFSVANKEGYLAY